MQLTKQKVRDLNGLKMDSKNYNGRREGHRHNPGTPMLSDLEDRTVVVDDSYYGPREEIKTVRVYRCAFCLVELDVAVD